MKDISQHQSNLVNEHSTRQRWMVGCGMAVVLGSLGAFLAVRHNPDLLVPLIRSGAPLAWASPYSHTIAIAMEHAAIPQIRVQNLKQLIDSKDSNYLLLDVRTPEEFKLSHIPGATLVPVDKLDKAVFIDKVKSLLKGRKLIAYCTSGHRSTQALTELNHAGIKGTQVTGGIKAWTEQIDPSLPRNNW